MSSIAVTCGLIILVLLVIMLLAGVPIAVALAVSSIAAILPVLNTGAAVLTGAQRIFSGISVFSLLAIPFFILAGNLMNKGGIAIRLINFAKLFTGRIPGALAHTNAVANMLVWRDLRFWYSSQLPLWVLLSDLLRKKKVMTVISPQQQTLQLLLQDF